MYHFSQAIDREETLRRLPTLNPTLGQRLGVIWAYVGCLDTALSPIHVGTKVPYSKVRTKLVLLLSIAVCFHHLNSVDNVAIPRQILLKSAYFQVSGYCYLPFTRESAADSHIQI